MPYSFPFFYSQAYPPTHFLNTLGKNGVPRDLALDVVGAWQFSNTGGYNIMAGVRHKLGRRNFGYAAGFIYHRDTYHELATGVIMPRAVYAINTYGINFDAYYSLRNVFTKDGLFVSKKTHESIIDLGFMAGITLSSQQALRAIKKVCACKD